MFCFTDGVDNVAIVKRSLNEEVTCLETSSPLYSYRWKYFDGESSTIVSQNLTLTLTKPGLYTCEAERRGSGNVCIVRPIQIVVEAEEYLILVVSTGKLILIFSLGFIYYKQQNYR